MSPLICPVTGFLHGPSDRRRAARLRTAALRARAVYPWLPLNYRDREAMKSDGWAGPDGLLVLRSHFARSLSGRDFNLSRHPSFETYAAAYLGNPHTTRLFGPAAVAELADRIGVVPCRSVCLPSGETTWFDKPKRKRAAP